jgi:histidinol dehydrogenase
VDPEVRRTTADIIEAVRVNGDAAIRSLAHKYESVALDEIEVPAQRMPEALASLPRDLRGAMERAARNIRRAHELDLPRATEVETEPGVVIGRRPDPLDRVGIYAPGGRASYPSSVLMGAIPARCAGVREILLCTPPGRDGMPSQAVLGAAHLAGVDRVFAAGGAGAVAAMALGTATIPRVQIIVGPGNVYVAEAKMQLSGVVAFDAPAGPSELLVLADDAASPAVVAHEMLAQAEHDSRACVVTVCESVSWAARLVAEIEKMLLNEPRRVIIADALKRGGAVMWSDSLMQRIAFANEYAAEHVLIAMRNAADVFAGIHNSGTVFLGEDASVSFGDYMTGGNHVLPTGGLARCYSGLSTAEFVRWTTWQRVSRDAGRSLAEDVAVFAEAENLPAHAAAARLRGK